MSRAPSTILRLQELRRVLSALLMNGPEPAALADAKDRTLNAFAFNFGSPVAQMQRILVYDLLGQPQV